MDCSVEYVKQRETNRKQHRTGDFRHNRLTASRRRRSHKWTRSASSSIGMRHSHQCRVFRASVSGNFVHSVVPIRLSISCGEVTQPNKHAEKCDSISTISQHALASGLFKIKWKTESSCTAADSSCHQIECHWPTAHGYRVNRVVGRTEQTGGVPELVSLRKTLARWRLSN